MAVVGLEGLTKVYPGADAAAVEGVTLTVGDGEFMVLLGPSGCGKSTTLRMIAGLESISAGRLTIDGAPMNRVPAKDRDIAMVFQSYALYPHMRVRDNLAFGLRRRGFPKAEIDARVDRVAAMLGLTPFLARKPHALSGGQRQRVALGRAIVREPKVFLFDEPLSNLDAALRVGTRGELIRLHQRLGATMIYVTHDQVEAMTMGTRICIMNRGRVVQLGPPLEVYRDPANTFVARFLGNPPMNLVPATVEADGEGAVAVRVGGGTWLPLRGWSPAALTSSEVVFGVRPEDLYEAAPGGGAGNGGGSGAGGPFATIAARVVAVEPLGAETLLVVTLEGVEEEVTARVGRDSRARPGDRLELHLDLSAAHLFDPTTTRAIPPDRRS